MCFHLSQEVQTTSLTARLSLTPDEALIYVNKIISVCEFGCCECLWCVKTEISQVSLLGSEVKVVSAANSQAALTQLLELLLYSCVDVTYCGMVICPLRRWDEAAADYTAVLAVAPADPSAWNNLGNTNMGAPPAAAGLRRHDSMHSSCCAVFAPRVSSMHMQQWAAGELFCTQDLSSSAVWPLHVQSCRGCGALLS
jgi:hypothetical protein